MGSYIFIYLFSSLCSLFYKQYKTFISEDAVLFIGFFIFNFLFYVYYYIYKVSANQILLIFLFVTSGYYTFSFNIMILMLALGLITIFVIYLYEKLKMIAVPLISIAIHLSLLSLSLLAFVYVVYSKSKIYNKKTFIGIVSLSYILLSIKELSNISFLSTMNLDDEKHTNYINDVVLENIPLMVRYLHTAFCMFIIIVTPKINDLFLYTYEGGVIFFNLLRGLKSLFLRVCEMFHFFRIILYADLWYSRKTVKLDIHIG